MSKILVTGAAGLFGSHLSEYLQQQGHRVYGIDNLKGGYQEYVSEYIHFTQMDLRSSDLKNYFKRNKPEYVYHTAAFAAVGLSHFAKIECFSNNMIGYANLVNNCVEHNIRKIIHFSSMDVYGTGNPPFQEGDVLAPEDTYGISKHAIEQDLIATHKQFGLNYSIIRPHNVFGPRQNIWDRYRNVLGIWILKCLNGQPITVYGDGSQRRSFSHVKYYMEPLEKLMNPYYNGLIFNLGADEYITILEAAQLMQKIAAKKGYKSEIVHLEPRNEVHFAYSDHTLAKNLLKFQDNTNLEELLIEMFDWAETQPKRQIKTATYELEKGLYSYWK